MRSAVRTASLSAPPRLTGKAPTRDTNLPRSGTFHISALAMKCTLLGHAAPTNTGSAFVTWLDANTIGPSFGTFSNPVILILKLVLTTGGMRACTILYTRVSNGPEIILGTRLVHIYDP